MEIGALLSWPVSQAQSIFGHICWRRGWGGAQLEDVNVSFLQAILSRLVNAQFHSHVEIASAKNTLPDIGKYVIVSKTWIQ